MYITESAQVVLSNSSMHSNVAHDGGGGLCAMANARISIAAGSLLSNNTAGYGGGLQAGGSATVYLTGGSHLEGNMAPDGCGGGMYVAESAIVLVTTSSMDANEAHDGGGAFCAMDHAHVRVADGSSISNNIAAGSGGGGGELAFGETQASPLLEEAACMETRHPMGPEVVGLLLTMPRWPSPTVV